MKKKKIHGPIEEKSLIRTKRVLKYLRHTINGILTQRGFWKIHILMKIFSIRKGLVHHVWDDARGFL